jgi:hypothetical protein
MDNHQLWSLNWEIVEHFLTQCAIQFPHSFDYVARVIVWRIRTNREIDKPLWTEVARLTAFQNGKLGRDSEVAWAIWLLKELKQGIPKTLSDTLLTNSGSLVLSLLAHFPKHRLASDRNLYARMWEIVDGDPFAGPYWPLTLELTHLDKSDPKWGGSSTQGVLRTLHDAKISIIDWNALPRVFIVEPPDGDGDDGPDYAIEDYGSDYGEDGEYEEGEEEDVPRLPKGIEELFKNL